MSGLTLTIIIKKFDIISLSEKCEVVQTRDHLPMIPRGISCCGGVFCPAVSPEEKPPLGAVFWCQRPPQLTEGSCARV